MLAKAKGLDLSRLLKLAQVQTELKASLEEMLALVDKVLHPEPYSQEEICKALSITSEQFSTELLSANTQHGMPLQQVAEVLTDQLSQIVKICRNSCIVVDQQINVIILN